MLLRYLSWAAPPFKQSDTEDEREEQLVLLKQRAANILVYAVREIIVESSDPDVYVARLLTVVDCLDTETQQILDTNPIETEQRITGAKFGRDTMFNQ